MARKTDQATAIRLIKDILYARRNRKLAREQAAYDKLYAWCQQHGYDFADTLNSGAAYIRRTDIAAMMNSL